MRRLFGWSVIVPWEEYQSGHLVSRSVASLTACFVLVSEVYMRPIVSARGIRFFSGGEQNLPGESTDESWRERCEAGELGGQALFFKRV